MQNGKDTVLIVQLATNALGEDGYLIGHLTENSHSIENELVDEQTKFGRILAYGTNRVNPLKLRCLVTKQIQDKRQF